MTVGERRLKSEVASVELSLRKVRGLLWGMVSDMVIDVLVFDFRWKGVVGRRKRSEEKS
jgi:hypothetical protein